MRIRTRWTMTRPVVDIKLAGQIRRLRFAYATAQHAIANEFADALRCDHDTALNVVRYAIVQQATGGRP